MIQRRHAMAAAAGSLAGLPSLAQPRPMTLQTLAIPEPMAQLAAGGPTGLLGVSTSGNLWALPLQATDRASRLGDGLDADTPVAAGHGRIAARRSDGALWVLQDGRAGVSTTRRLAPAAGLLVLPLAIIGVQADGRQHHLVRFESTGPGGWRTVAQSDMAVLPDAQAVQADLDGAGDGGHLVVLAGPDGQRYRHGVLGDAIEATRIVLLERHSLRVMRDLVLDAPYVFEDIAPRKVALAPGTAPGTPPAWSREGLVAVQAGPLGGQMVLVDADPSAPGRLRIAAQGNALGTANRWMSPIIQGPHWLAVHTPHIGGILHVYRRDGSQLQGRRLRGDISNHRIGSRQLDMSAWHGQFLLIPDQSGRRLLLLDSTEDWRTVAEQGLPAHVTAMLGLGPTFRNTAQAAVLLADGSVLSGLL